MYKTFEGEVEIGLMEDIIKSIPKLEEIYRDDYVFLIHGMGCKERTYYNTIQFTKNVELLWTGWSSVKWWTYLLRFIPGESGLVKIRDKKNVDKLFMDIGEQSMCGLYFMPENKVNTVLEDVKSTRGKNINEIFKNENLFFLLIVDFDYMGTDKYGEIYYRQLILGENISEATHRALTKTI